MANNLKFDYVFSCIDTLEKAIEKLNGCSPESDDYNVARYACIKGFELSLEQCGKMLKKHLSAYFASPKAVDALIFKDVFRHAAKHSLLDEAACRRWLEYRDNRNQTAHDYGQALLDNTLPLLGPFIRDARQLMQLLQKNHNNK